MAPEMIRNKFSDFRADLWSLGCTLYQLLDGLPPFTARSEYLVYVRAMRRDLEFPLASEEAIDLIDKLVIHEPDNRFGARTGGIKALKAHPFFKGYDFPNAHRKPKPVMSLVDCCLRTIGQRYKVCLENLPDEDERYELFTDAWVAAHPELSPHIKARLKRIKRNVILEHKMHPEEGHEEDDEDRALVDNIKKGDFGAMTRRRSRALRRMREKCSSVIRNVVNPSCIHLCSELGRKLCNGCLCIELSLERLQNNTIGRSSETAKEITAALRADAAKPPTYYFHAPLLTA